MLGKAGIDVVGSARTEAEGYEVIERERPSLAIVDLGLEHGSGVQLARRLSDAEWDLGVLIYTGLGTSRCCARRSTPARAASR